MSEKIINPHDAFFKQYMGHAIAVLPKEGGILMQTMAEAWIEEGKTIGLKEGREEGKFQERIDVIIRLLRRRFQPTEETLQTLVQQLTQIRQEATLSQLVDLALDVLVLPDFMTKVQALLPAAPPANSQE